MSSQVRKQTDDYIKNHKLCRGNNAMGQDPFLHYHKDESYYLNVSDSILCKHNSTFSFLALDSHLYPEFISRLGGGRFQKRSYLTLIDFSDESYYQLDSQLNRRNIGKWIFKIPLNQVVLIRLLFSDVVCKL